MEIVCSICEEYLVSPCTSTTCGHLFHEPCIKRWFETQKGEGRGRKYSCPNCCAEQTRGASGLIKIYLNETARNSPLNSTMKLSSVQILKNSVEELLQDKENNIVTLTNQCELLVNMQTVLNTLDGERSGARSQQGRLHNQESIVDPRAHSATRNTSNATSNRNRPISMAAPTGFSLRRPPRPNGPGTSRLNVAATRPPNANNWNGTQFRAPIMGRQFRL